MALQNYKNQIKLPNGRYTMVLFSLKQTNKQKIYRDDQVYVLEFM